MSEGMGLPGGEEPRERRMPRDETPDGTPDGTRDGTDETTESAANAERAESAEPDGRAAGDRSTEERPVSGAADGPEEGGSGGDDSAPEEMSLDLFDESALTSEEETLRELLHSSVRGIEPPADSLDRTLDHLHRAVPARRAHRRQAMVGGVAATLVAVVGVPALFYGGVVPGVGGDDQPVTAASTHGQTRGPDAGSGGSGGKDEDKHTGGKDKDKGKGDKGGGSAHPAPSGGPGDSADPNESLSASAPTCGSDQLGAGSAQSGVPDSSGTVYGSFRVANVSGNACTVEGEGIVGASVQGSGGGQVVVVDHAPGDPAPGLGDPAASRDEVVLRPGQAYVVKFAFVPSGCSSPTPQGGRYDGETSGPSAGAGEGSADGGGDSAGGGTGTPGESNGGSGDPGGGDAEVVVSHTPESGAPVAGTRVPGACGSGTIYRTGVIPQG
ncbi:hypothetical protein [Streptomyces sp. RK75]|uniref:hypothetical protein n=1 Tax=Streptomyces sp. RK75 TaxID=2824895 RepID=UPI001608AD4A|nr:hypothetical protein [Streptomyces sp. RK75]MBQ0864667.1 hypothetical protein [Streptomyces sp. RK75]